ncbi:putative lipoprotein [Leptospira interrogans serovar Icterohaemorrhagiae str. Verdun HP]|uniref:Putative lipoprotein n=1 Tax=Leptospira interrogans serovar Icterohaemorrhagiae str. Verdun HP TaxID=1049910 RepID=M6S2H8_LEPIR|nr:putative lipoprotein [Leptospira interrogans serovar Icterohaemorrhagiae str. Verdun HP]
MFLKERFHKSLSLVPNLIIFHFIQACLLFKREEKSYSK